MCYCWNLKQKICGNPRNQVPTKKIGVKMLTESYGGNCPNCGYDACPYNNQKALQNWWLE